MRLQGKVAVVTGGGRGIGQAIALAFAREGADVVVTARTTHEIESVASEVKRLGRKGVAIPVDLSQREAIRPCVEHVFSHFPTVHILVNNAAIGGAQNPKLLTDYDDDFWEMSLFVNLTVPYLLTKAFLPTMLEQDWGRIINIASGAGKRGTVNRGAYSASKHGLIGLTRTAALEVATSGVTVNAICPGPIRTVMLTRLLQQRAESQGTTREEVEKSSNPMQRLLEPEEVADLAVYLASEAAQGMTGQSLNINGGSIMH
jgi:NAD(P)-dependent dehydrogenase (short-subunit alcohol dehydrogenase family)